MKIHSAVLYLFTLNHFPVELAQVQTLKDEFSSTCHCWQLHLACHNQDRFSGNWNPTDKTLSWFMWWRDTSKCVRIRPIYSPAVRVNHKPALPLVFDPAHMLLQIPACSPCSLTEWLVLTADSSIPERFSSDSHPASIYVNDGGCPEACHLIHFLLLVCHICPSANIRAKKEPSRHPQFADLDSSLPAT